jgi:deazaflavin-dependent oxidoreductase (nitroreductase family)
VRSQKYRVVTTLERGSNRLIRLALRAGLAPRAFALLETTGRRTGRARQTPVGNGLDGDIFWLVAAHGTQADYVRNLQAEPRVRVKAGGVWRAGTAVVLPGDDAAARSRSLPCQWDAAVGRMMASAPLTIRIDLGHEPEEPGTAGRLPIEEFDVQDDGGAGAEQLLSGRGQRDREGQAAGGIRGQRDGHDRVGNRGDLADVDLPGGPHVLGPVVTGPVTGWADVDDQGRWPRRTCRRPDRRTGRSTLRSWAASRRPTGSGTR